MPVWQKQELRTKQGARLPPYLLEALQHKLERMADACEQAPHAKKLLNKSLRLAKMRGNWREVIKFLSRKHPSPLAPPMLAGASLHRSSITGSQGTMLRELQDKVYVPSSSLCRPLISCKNDHSRLCGCCDFL